MEFAITLPKRAWGRIEHLCRSKKPDARLLDGFPVPDTLPPWLSESDLDHYVAAFEKTGVSGALGPGPAGVRTLGAARAPRDRDSRDPLIFGASEMKETILELQSAFDRAELEGDTEALARLLTDDFASIGPKGFVLDKTAWIGRHAQFKYQALELSEVDVRLYDGAAIVRNVQQNRATYNGQQIAIGVRVSQTWVRTSGAWKLAGIQFSPLVRE